MMKAYRLAVFSAVVLLGRSPAAVVVGASPPQGGTTPGVLEEDPQARSPGLRILKHHSKRSKGTYHRGHHKGHHQDHHQDHHQHRHHHHPHSHHQAIQDMFEEQYDTLLGHDEEYEIGHHDDHNGDQDFFEEDDDYAYYGHQTTTTYYDIEFPDHEYLDEDITPRPFQNCIPESFHGANTYGKRHHHKYPKKGHHDPSHEYGGLDHHHHKHDHKGNNFLGGYNGVDDEIDSYYNSKSKAVKGRYDTGTYDRATGKGKGKGKAKYYKGSKSSKSSKGYHYYRQRRLTRRNGPARRGHRGHHHRHTSNENVPKLRAGHIVSAMYDAKDDTEEGAGHDDEDEDEDHHRKSRNQKSKVYKDGRNHHPHKHSHAKGGLPLCPNIAPKRRTFGPVPTIAPFEAPTVAGNETMEGGPGDGDEEQAGEPIPEDAGDEGFGAPDNGGNPAGRGIIIESTMTYGFFPEFQDIRAPTMEEIDAVLERTAAWYLEQLKATYPTLENFEANFVTSEFDMAAEDPIRLQFDANAIFPDGAEQPTPQELFGTMQNLNYQDYIRDAVWTPDRTGGIFEETNLAGFNGNIQQAP